MKLNKKTWLIGLPIVVIFALVIGFFGDSSLFLGLSRKKSVSVPWFCMKPVTTGVGDIDLSGGSTSGNGESGGQRGGGSTTTDNTSRKGGGFFVDENTVIDRGLPEIESLTDGFIRPYSLEAYGVDGSDTVAKDKEIPKIPDGGGSGTIPGVGGLKKPVLKLSHVCSCKAAFFDLPEIPDKTFSCLSSEETGVMTGQTNGVDYELSIQFSNSENCPKDLKDDELYSTNAECGCDDEFYYDEFLGKKFECPKNGVQVDYKDGNKNVNLTKKIKAYCSDSKWQCPVGYEFNFPQISTRCEALLNKQCTGEVVDAGMLDLCDAFFPNMVSDWKCPSSGPAD